MDRKKSQEIADAAPAIPYQDCWEEIGGNWVSLESLAVNVEEYERYEELAAYLGLELPCPGKEDFEALAANFELSPALANQLAQHAWRIAGFYLTPKRKKELRNGLGAHRDLLADIAKHSRELYRLTNRLTNRVHEVMGLVRSTQPGVIDRTGPTPKELAKILHDLPLIAERIAQGLAPQPGRPSEHLRDSTIRLAIQAAQAAGLDDLVISRELRVSSQPFLKGRSGQFLMGFLKLVGVDLNEANSAAVIERVRRQMKV